MTVAKLLAGAGFTKKSAAAAREVEEVTGKLPADLRELIMRATGEYLGGHSFMRVFEPDEMVDVRGQRGLHAELPGYLYFASDDGDCFYALTPAGGVVKVERGAAAPAHVKPCAADLRMFVERTLAGESWLKVERERAGVRAGAPPSMTALREAGQRCNVLLSGSPLDELVYETANGFTLGDVTIRSIERVEPVAGVTIDKLAHAGAVWFADLADGSRWAFVTGKVGKLREGDVIAVAKGGHFATGKRLGALADVIAGLSASKPKRR